MPCAAFVVVGAFVVFSAGIGVANHVIGAGQVRWSVALRVPGGEAGEDQHADHRDEELQRRAGKEEIHQSREHDAEQAANTLKTLIPNENLRKAMGNSARKLVEARYTWDRVASMTETAYFEYLEEFPSRDLVKRGRGL